MGPGRLLSLIFAVGTVYGTKQSLEIIPSNGEVQLGEKTIFLCKVRRGGEAELTWIDPKGEEVSPDSEKPYKEKRIDEVSKQLEMTLTDLRSDGVFQCRGDFESGESVTVQIRIYVVQRPTFVKMMESEKEVAEGSTVNFSCQATGIPPPNVTWLFGNQELGLVEDGRIFTDRGLLTIEKTQPSDAGVYSCKASNEKWQEVAFMNVTLQVKFTPRIEPPDESLDAPQIGKPTRFNFTVLANPVPSVSVSWKDQVFEGNDVVKVAADQNRYLYSFEFTPVSQEDISDFVITAANEMGRAEKKLPFKEEAQYKGLGIGSILAIVLAFLLVVWLVMDTSCYYKRRRGLLMYCRTHILRKEPPGDMAENNQCFVLGCGEHLQWRSNGRSRSDLLGCCAAKEQQPSRKVFSKSEKSTVVNVSGLEA